MVAFEPTLAALKDASNVEIPVGRSQGLTNSPTISELCMLTTHCSQVVLSTTASLDRKLWACWESTSGELIPDARLRLAQY